MKCSSCISGITGRGRATFVADRDGRVAVIRDVPADICTQCGEEYFDSETAKAVYDQAERILAHGSEVEITRFTGDVQQ